MRSLRAGNSTRLVQPEPSDGTFSWNGLTPFVTTLAPAGHPPGLYKIVVTGFVRTIANAGTGSATLAWSQPNFGPTSLQVNLGTFTINTVTGFLRVIRSTGLQAITATWAVAGLVGSPSIEIADTALIAARPFTGITAP